MSFLLDTNLISETRSRKANRGVTEWISSIPDNRLFLSALTIGEIGRGITRLSERNDELQAERFRVWLDEVVGAFDGRILPADLQVARTWAEFSQRQPLPIIDSLIAATAVTHRLTLVTRNTKDFERTGIQLLNPFTD